MLTVRPIMEQVHHELMELLKSLALPSLGKRRLDFGDQSLPSSDEPLLKKARHDEKKGKENKTTAPTLKFD